MVLKTLLHPCYFPNIATFSMIVSSEICWEAEDNYQKQTYRNRSYICTDQGKHMLSIPIQHVGGNQGRQKYKSVILDDSEQWQRQHWRTLQTAYRTSPFFEFYEDEIAPLFEKSYKYLYDFNLETINTVCDCLQVDFPVDKTESFRLEPLGMDDKRVMVSAKRKVSYKNNEYHQVFGDRHDFIENLSVLDLLFNEGTNALAYLRQFYNLNFND